MRRDILLAVVGLALLLCGCPKRQTGSRVVYVAAPNAVAANTPAKTGGEMVIEEPPPPEPPEPPPEATPQEPTTQKTPARPRRRATTPSETPVETQTPETTEPPPVTAPALEPRESPQQQTALRLRVLQSQESVQARIGSLQHSPMASVDKKTLEDARMFLNQSRKALDGGDLQRAFNLARKASLLVDALEQKP